MQHTTRAARPHTTTPVKRYENGATFVPALPARRPLALSAIPAPSEAVIDLVRAGNADHHARQDDSAITHAQATLLVAGAYAVAIAMITCGLVLLAWLFRALGGAWSVYAYTGLIVWGLAALGALYGNRGQGLRHTATGVAHHDIDARTEVAMHAIDVHAELLRERLRLEGGRHEDH